MLCTFYCVPFINQHEEIDETVYGQVHTGALGCHVEHQYPFSEGFGEHMRRAIIYRRTAASQDDTTFALDTQTYQCQAFCQERSYEVIAVITDEGQSGCSLARPGLRRMRELIAVGQADVVVTTSMDRLTRRVDHWLILHHEFVRVGGAIVTVRDGDTAETTAEIIRSIYSQFAAGASTSRITHRLNKNTEHKMS